MVREPNEHHRSDRVGTDERSVSTKQNASQRQVRTLEEFSLQRDAADQLDDADELKDS